MFPERFHSFEGQKTLNFSHLGLKYFIRQNMFFFAAACLVFSPEANLPPKTTPRFCCVYESLSPLWRCGHRPRQRRGLASARGINTSRRYCISSHVLDNLHILTGYFFPFSMLLSYYCHCWKLAPRQHHVLNAPPLKGTEQPLHSDVWNLLKSLGVLRKYRGKRARRVRLLALKPLYSSSLRMQSRLCTR